MTSGGQELGSGLRLSNPFVARLGGPAGFWIAWEPRAWPSSRQPYCGLAGGLALVGGGSAATVREDVPANVLDTVWLPPVDPGAEQESAVDRLRERLRAGGVPVLRQLAGEPGAAAVDAGPNEQLLWDPLPLLLAGDRDRLVSTAAALPAGVAAVWPLLGAVAGEEELQAVLAVLAEVGAVALQPLRLELAPAARRWCAERLDEPQWERAFRPSPELTPELLRTIRRAGLAPILPRPALREPLRSRGRNRALASELLVAAELAFRLGHPAGRVAELAGVARRLELLVHDVRVLWREGNLGVLDFLGTEDEREVAAWCASGRLPLRSRLESELEFGEASAPQREPERPASEEET
jgi:hypothetical protein